jgi:hypothetical protein
MATPDEDTPSRSTLPPSLRLADGQPWTFPAPAQAAVFGPDYEAIDEADPPFAAWRRRLTRALRRARPGGEGLRMLGPGWMAAPGPPRPGSTRAGPIPGPPHFYSNASHRPRVAFGELTYGIYVTASPDDAAPIGVAIETGWTTTGDGLPEAAWQLVVRGEYVVNHYTLRRGAFVALAEGC